ncbi:MAG: RraA family protein [Janthinobacterium lividum]
MPDEDPSTPDLLARLARVDTTSLADAGPVLGVLPPEIAALRPGSRLVGRAVVAGARDDLVPVLVALRSSGPGDVLALSGTPGRALAGELFGTEAMRRGLAGLVIDGFCRDSRTLRSMDLPVFTRGVSPRAYGAFALPPAEGPVQIGDVLVSSGDLVLADDDGVVVGSPADVAAAIDGAEAIQRREEALRAAIERGESLFDHLNVDEHLAALRDGRDSRLAFS